MKKGGGKMGCVSDQAETRDQKVKSAGAFQNVSEPGLSTSCNVGTLFFTCHIWILLSLYFLEKQFAILGKCSCGDAVS